MGLCLWCIYGALDVPTHPVRERAYTPYVPLPRARHQSSSYASARITSADMSSESLPEDDEDDEALELL